MTAPTPRNYNNVTTRGQLSGGVSPTDVSLITAGLNNEPAVPFTITIERNTPGEEVCLVTAVNGDVLTVQRGYDGTAAQTHLAGAAIEHTAVARDFREANQHTTATEGVHGTTGSLVGTEGPQTVMDKTLLSPVMEADAALGDAVVAYVPAGSETRNLFRGMDPNGDDVAVINASGATALKSVTVTDAPAGASSLTRKDYVDAAVAGLNSRLATAEGDLAAATSVAGANKIIRADANGYIAVNAPVASAHPGTKGYVDSTAAAAPRMVYTSGTLAASGTYTLALTDEGKILTNVNATGAYTVTIPTQAAVNFPFGAAIDVVRYGPNALTVNSAAGVQIVWGGVNSSTNTISLARYQAVRLTKVAATVWFAYDLTDVSGPTQPAGELLRVDQTANVSATTTTPVNITGINGTTFTLTSARKVQAILHVITATGASGGELGRVGLTINAVVRRSQWFSPNAGANGEVSPVVLWQETLPAGTYTVTATVLRVSGGTSVTVGSSLLVVNDVGA